MICSQAGSNLQWYVVQTKPNQEERANYNLSLGGIETFLPKLKEQKSKTRSRVTVSLTKPLFPRYLFAKFNSDQLLHTVTYTRGVQNVVRFGDAPTPVDDEIIQIIKSQVHDDGFIRIDAQFNPGDKVVIKEGPLKDLVGIFEHDIKHTNRIMILLRTVSYQVSVKIEKSLVEKIPSDKEKSRR